MTQTTANTTIQTLRKASLMPALLLLLSAAAPARALAVTADDDSAYAAGTRAMNEHRWADALVSFDHVVDAKSKKADAALYWKAYSLNKLGRGGLALATCSQLRSHYTSSQWNKDCSALAIDLRADIRPPAAPVPPVGPVFFRDNDDPDSRSHDPNAELKILALNSLLNRDPAQAIPLLRGILTGDQPANIKRHAISVLAQSRSPEAANVLHDVVAGKMGVDLQRQAIQMSAVFQGKRANDGLAEAYRATSDFEVKKSIISAFFITGDAQRMVDLARSEKNMELKRSIVSQLALMPDKVATDYMLELLR